MDLTPLIVGADWGLPRRRPLFRCLIGEPVGHIVAFDAHVAGRPLDQYIMRLHSAVALKERPLGGRGGVPLE